MGLKLYGLALSTCATRAMACLHEKGVDFELLSVNMSAGEHKQPPFIEKNPFGQIPVLEDDGLTLFESRAITEYVATKYKDTGCDLLRHKDPKEAALVKVWMEVEAHQFNPTISPIFYETMLAPIMEKREPNKSLVDINLEKLGKVLDVYEAKLSKTKYLAGDFFSMADLHHLSLLHYFMKTPYASLVNDRAHVKAWWEDISSRPSFKKISPAMTFG
ncbi:hypothetical protein LguiA_011400 [Lonicera macranthoides]